MKKLIRLLLLSALLVLEPIPECPHIHDEYCGYDEKLDTGCTHEHDESCYITPYFDPEDGRS